MGALGAMGEAPALADGAMGARERGREGTDEGERGEEREGEALVADPGKVAGMEGLQSRRGGRSISNDNQWNGGDCEGDQVRMLSLSFHVCSSPPPACAVASPSMCSSPPQHVQQPCF